MTEENNIPEEVEKPTKSETKKPRQSRKKISSDELDAATKAVENMIEDEKSEPTPIVKPVIGPRKQKTPVDKQAYRRIKSTNRIINL